MQQKPRSSSEKLRLEDLRIGETVAFGRKHLTRDEIVAFASAYDPQLIHLDEEVAKKSIVAGLCASGFHSCAILMRMLVDDVLAHTTSLGSPGMDEVKWLKPVRPGDVLTGRYTCTDKRALASRPDVGLAKVTFEMLNQHGQVVMIWRSNQLLAIRHPEPVIGRTNQPSSGPAPLKSLWQNEAVPAPSLSGNFLEDRTIGEMTELGSHTFGKDEIVAFARAWDPQPFHLDEAAGKASLLGGLCASGWHTAAIYIRLSVAARSRAEARIRANGGQIATYGPSPGFRNIRWVKPVYPGDTLTFRTCTIDKVVLRSRPDRGILVSQSQARNQRGDIVFGVQGEILVERRT